MPVRFRPRAPSIQQQQLEQQENMYKSPNPMDPFDSFKRWYRELWPLQRVGVWLCAAVAAYAAFGWITI